MRDVVIVAAVRTPIGAFGGALRDFTSVELGTIVVKKAMERIGLSAENVDELIFGNVLQAGQGMNVARQISVYSGIPNHVPSYTVNKLCGSGLKAVALAAQSIMTGENEVVIAGGTESMSQAPFLLSKSRWGQRLGHGEVLDTILRDGLIDTFHDIHMGITAENIVEEYGFTREEQDMYALESQKRAQLAMENGKFKEEIVPMRIPQRKGEDILFDKDEYPKFNSTIEKIARLKPAFVKNGTVTAANASGINDGAAALIVMSKEKADALGLQPMATIRSFASAGVDPRIMGTGPIPAVKKAMKLADITKDQIDLIEANEAFASQTLAVMKDIGMNPDITNVNGGAIALGHPIGASGARILVTLLHEMEKRDSKNGLATLCIGGGQGIAMIVQRD